MSTHVQIHTLVYKDVQCLCFYIPGMLAWPSCICAVLLVIVHEYCNLIGQNRYYLIVMFNDV